MVTAERCRAAISQRLSPLVSGEAYCRSAFASFIHSSVTHCIAEKAARGNSRAALPLHVLREPEEGFHSTQPSVFCTALSHSRRSRWRSGSFIVGSQRLSSRQLARRSSSPFQKPTANPAA